VFIWGWDVLVDVIGWNSGAGGVWNGDINACHPRVSGRVGIVQMSRETDGQKDCASDIVIILLHLHSCRKLCHLVIEGNLASFNFLVELLEVVGGSVSE